MRAPVLKILTIMLTAMFTLSMLGDALARQNKPRGKRPPPMARDYDGTPVIMRGLDQPRSIMRDEDEPRRRRAEGMRAVPRGSSTYIPPPVPSPGAGPPAPALLQPPAATYRPPPIDSFSDRVTSCVHSYPLNAGIGNNPTDRQAYIRQCAN